MGRSLLITPTREWMKGNPFPLYMGLTLKQTPLYILFLDHLQKSQVGLKIASPVALICSIVFTRVFILHEKHPRNARES